MKILYCTAVTLDVGIPIISDSSFGRKGENIRIFQFTTKY